MSNATNCCWRDNEGGIKDPHWCLAATSQILMHHITHLTQFLGIRLEAKHRSGGVERKKLKPIYRRHSIRACRFAGWLVK